VPEESRIPPFGLKVTNLDTVFQSIFTEFLATDGVGAAFGQLMKLGAERSEKRESPGFSLVICRGLWFVLSPFSVYSCLEI
jgi:hypothetical protein